MSITLPVSLGEALDKLSILDIKLQKISDERRKDVENEYSVLFSLLKEHVMNHQYYYNILKSTNLSIWEMQDDFRYNKGDKIKLCMRIIEDNDRRFRIKKKINNATNSILKEQKGYNKKQVVVFTHLGLGDNITAIGMVRYLSTCYDKVIVIAKSNNSKNVESFYCDDPSIEVHSVPGDPSPRSYVGFNTLSQGKDVVLCGVHAGKPIHDLPFCFYHDANVPLSTFWEYFYIPESENDLYHCVEGNEYVFVHNTSSTGKVFDLETVEEKCHFNRDDILVINPCYNTYTKGHKFYDVAEKFAMAGLTAYINTIKNAKIVILSDSSFLSMALNLDIKTTQCYYKARGNGDYDYLFTDKYNFPKSNRQKFIKI